MMLVSPVILQVAGIGEYCHVHLFLFVMSRLFQVFYFSLSYSFQVSFRAEFV